MRNLARIVLGLAVTAALAFAGAGVAPADAVAAQPAGVCGTCL